MPLNLGIGNIRTTKKNNPDKCIPSHGPLEKPIKSKEPNPAPSVDEDGFWSLEGQKRARPVSPKSNSGLSTKNIYSVLEESSPAKKKASNESPVAIPSGTLNRNRDKSQSPNRHMEVESPQIPRMQEKTRIPFLNRKTSRNKNSSDTSSQSKGKTGNTKFQL